MNEIKSFLSLSPSWMIRPDALSVVASQYHAIASGSLVLSEEQVEAAKQARVPKVKGAIAVMRMSGVLFSSRNFYTDYGYGTALDEFGEAHAALVANQDIKLICILGDTPGGSAVGCQPLADKIFESRSVKPTIALANPEVASAGLFVLSAASQLYVVPDGWIGSVGTIMGHYEYSEMLKMLGIKSTTVFAGKYKNEMDDEQPLTEEAIAERQRIVDHYYDMFVGGLSKYRGKTTKYVKDNFGQGRMLFPKEAVAVGMVDGEITKDALFAKIGGDMTKAPKRYSAEAVRLMRERKDVA